MALSLTPPAAFDPTTGHKRPGRRPIPDDEKLTSKVTIPMTKAMFDEVQSLSRAEGISAPQFFRRLYSRTRASQETAVAS